jgi:hypothetical protein
MWRRRKARKALTPRHKDTKKSASTHKAHGKKLNAKTQSGKAEKQETIQHRRHGETES